MITHLDLFSGIGGWALAGEMVGDIRTIGFCEIEPFPRQVLANHWPGVPIHDDITTLTADIVRGWAGGSPDLVTASYPCQGFSVAGQRRGEEDDRFLWPHVARLAEELRPRLLVAENVAGHISLGLDRVLADLEGLDYTGRAIVVPACAVGAFHRRDRVWILAHANGERCVGRADSTGGNHDHGAETRRTKSASRAEGGDANVPDSTSVFRTPVQRVESHGDVPRDGTLPDPDDAGCQEQRRAITGQPQYTTAECGGGRRAESGLGGTPDGFPGRMDSVAGGGFWDGDWERGVPRTVDPRSVPNSVKRLTALGNAIVPQVAAEILRVVTGGTA